MVLHRNCEFCEFYIEGNNLKNAFQMMNLLSNDVNRLDYSVFSLHYLWISPVQTIVIAYLLYEEVNLAALGGVVTLVLFVPLHGKILRFFDSVNF